AVGSALLLDLLKFNDFKTISTVGRREIKYDGNNKEILKQKIIDFENLDQYKEEFVGHDVVFNTFGTTRALAGSAENFERIDKGYVIRSAKIIKELNPDKEIHFLYCSAMNSNPNSQLLYPRVKGEIEKELGDIGFKKVSIFRPGYLKVEKRPENRRFEHLIVSAFSSVLDFVAPKRWGVHVDIVGRAMRKVGTGKAKTETEIKVLENGTIFE
ncbi:10596_t:CDS:2, partial [Acaulospora colombiana]